jgi:outer membrane protein OmpA-like peptidoglycan-associated protein
VMGTSTFVRELAPNRPWALIIAVGYAIDTRTPKPEVRVVSTTPAAPPPTLKKRIRGVVVERGFGTAIVGAVVRYPDHDLSPQLTGAGGLFTSYEFDPGEVVLEINHPDYDTGRCVVQISGPTPAAKPLTTGVQPPAAVPVPPPTSPAANGGSAPAAPAPGLALARCELVAHPRNGTLSGVLSNESGNPIAGSKIELSGPTARTLATGAGGEFAAQDLPPGDYIAKIDAAEYLFKQQPFTIGGGSDTNLPITLTAKPRVAQVMMTAREVKIGIQIVFRPNSAEIDERSTSLLNEIADVLQRNPNAHVQVQGHTDNRGDPAANLTLSQQRAESVVQALVSAGIEPSRLEAMGYGDERPLVPNLTPDNRARNRRVQFMIIK